MTEPGYLVLARRDLSVLSWNIDERPDRDSMWRYYLTGRAALGYAVLRTGGRACAPTAVVVDYLATARWVAPLLVAAGDAAREWGAVAMSVKTRHERADRLLRAAGFVRRSRGANEPIRFMVHSRDADLADQLRDHAGSSRQRTATSNTP